MIPIEADLQAEEQVEFDCVAADRVLAFMEAASTKVNMIIMDACRNNPFERSWHRSANGNGLAMMDAPTGTIIAYATAPGRVASDGESANGLYTSALLKYMKDPGLNVEQVFKRVRTEVTEKSSGAQVPWETTSLTGEDFFLKTSQTGSALKETKEVVQAGNSSDRSLDTEEDEQKAIEYYTEGAKHYDEQKYDLAIESYSQAIKANPLYTEAFLWRGHSKYASKNFDEAVHDYSKTIQLSPGDAEAYYYRGNAKYSLEKYTEAITDFTLTIKYEPKHGKAFYYRGLSYYFLKKYGAALDDLTTAVAIAPDANTYYWRGNSQYGLEEYVLAIEDFNKSLELDPNFSSAHLFKGHSLYNLEQFADALPSYSRTIELDDKSAEAYFWRGRTFEKLNRIAEAKKDIKKAIALDPQKENYRTFEQDLNKR
jgi:tetratricopeptide (TPR) repeat protein